jgi:RNA polymerase sigma factor (sigma-70 family)
MDDEQARLATLIGRIVQSDETALAALYDATIARVYGCAVRIVGNEQLAEEVAADVFFQVWNDASRYEAPRGGVLTWMLVMCRSRAIDRLRGRDRAILHEAPETLMEDWADEGQTPSHLVEAIETRNALDTALAKLPAIQRQLINLAFFRGLSHQEIAQHTQIPLGTGKSHIRRALLTLQRSLRSAAVTESRT